MPSSIDAADRVVQVLPCLFVTTLSCTGVSVMLSNVDAADSVEQASLCL